jgi:ribosomal protein S18 acetylase RimI-like enzyme
MRIRNYRQVDLPDLVHIQQAAARADGAALMSMQSFERWLGLPEVEAGENVFVITDDDETNVWGQAGTLEGLEGEVIGYSVLQLSTGQQDYRFLCQGAVLPAQRHRGAGRALLVCDLNRARAVAFDFEAEAEEQDRPLYFEALLPANDAAARALAAKCEMQPGTEPASEGMRLYRRELYTDA